MGSTSAPKGDHADRDRVMALGSELRRLHDHIRSLLDDVRDGAALSTASLDTDLLVHCRTFCTVLEAHHATEDAVLFPWLERTHPGLRSTLLKLEQDHALISGLLQGLAADLDRDAGGIVVLRHLEGLDAIMESHFRFEERELVAVLDAVGTDGPTLEESFWTGAHTIPGSSR